MRKISLTFLLIFSILFSRADEGMWLPIFLKYNEAEMQQLGFKLTAEDVYSVNKSSMKDAIVLFGSGCTGELISPNGLLITNHHCGYSFVQRHSTVEHNYLHNGFWAKNYAEELPNPGLTVTFLVRMEDVTTAVLQGVSSEMNEEERVKIVNENIKLLTAKAVQGTHYQAVIKPFFYGNQYFMFVNEVFEDVRLVGVPPESIGKFGGDTDNWVWPRHTGDFSLYRIYADKEGKPAPYSEDNVPLKSKKHFAISTQGVDNQDFTLVFGYPGRTQQFLLSDAVDIIANVQNPIAIEARTIRLDAMKYGMEQSVETRLMYSAKANSISNGWKKWIGESKGINDCGVVAMKRAEEEEFTQWVNADPKRKEQYDTLLPTMKRLYQDYRVLTQILTYNNEFFFGSEMVDFLSNHVLGMIFLTQSAEGQGISVAKTFDELKAGALKGVESFYKSYNRDIDSECFVHLMTTYFAKQRPEFIPDELRRYINASPNFFVDMSEKMMTEAPYFADSQKFPTFFAKATEKDFRKLKNNRFYQFIMPILVQTIQVQHQIKTLNEQLNSCYRTYIQALMEKERDKVFYPDANLTMRVTYGQVQGFSPADGVDYQHYTTLKGIIEKENPDIFDYKVEPKLKALYEARDFGRYANKKGELPIAFIASNHTTGGNSGSPVINAEGDLVGVNFDRVWEGTMSDIHYDVSRCRNISLDVRYFLFIVDKFADAQNILSELTIH